MTKQRGSWQLLVEQIGHVHVAEILLSDGLASLLTTCTYIQASWEHESKRKSRLGRANLSRTKLAIQFASCAREKRNSREQFRESWFAVVWKLTAKFVRCKRDGKKRAREKERGRVAQRCKEATMIQKAREGCLFFQISISSWKLQQVGREDISFLYLYCEINAE